MKKAKHQAFHLGWLDFSLSALASCLAVFSVGMGLRIPEISWFLCGWIAVGTVVSFVLCRLVPERYTWVSGLLYSMVSVGSVAYVQTLNSWLPKGGFPIQLIIAASLAWMLLFGSFLTWRDSTIVFQAVPSIALFGLVGAWDTFSGAPFAFFGFLLCFATLFARAHGRVMMMQAEDSGYAPVVQKVGDVESTATAYESLRKGPWRWMAGPEWALGSAAVIVLLSVLGAPVLQSSVQGVAGFVSIQVPQVAPSTAALSTAFATNSLGNVNVGQGPRKTLRKKPVFTARLSDMDGESGLTKKPMYFRVRTYGLYTGRGWQPIGEFPSRNLMAQALEDDKSFMNVSRTEVDPYVRLMFDLDLLSATTEGVPVPGDLEYLQSTRTFARRADGMIRQADNGTTVGGIGGVVRVPKPGDEPVRTKPIESVYSEDPDRRIPDRVKDLAIAVTAGAANDYEKAQRIKAEIAKRVVYNLDSPPVPAGSDPADWFLFEGKQGYCDLFATAMTVMARATGMPARYVTGYYPALGVVDGTGRRVLHESEAHAWCEIFFEGHGWVAFDATEGATDVGRPTSEETLMDKDWFRATLFTVGGLVVVAIPVVISMLVRRKRGPQDLLKRALGKQYNRFVGAMEKRTGKPKRPSQTPREYLDAIAPLLPKGLTEAKALTDRFEAILYSPSGIEATALGSLREEVSATVRAISSK